MKSSIFNSLLMMLAVGAAHLQFRELPARPASLPATVALSYRPVELAAVDGPYRLAGAWNVSVADRRFGGISSLTIDQNRFLAVSDRGSVMRFDRPDIPHPKAWVADLRHGPGPWGKKWSRDAESLVADPNGRGWWIGFEQNHSIWLYDRDLGRALASVDLKRPDWWNNRGAEGLLVADGKLLVLAENGRDAMQIDSRGPRVKGLYTDADIADAARAPDGSGWVLTRKKGLAGIEQSIAPLRRTHDGYVVGPGSPVPKGLFDNFEGMAIEARPDGGWRFWLVTDDGHRIMARTLLVALDVTMTIGRGRSPATSAGLSKKRVSKKL